MACTCTTRRMGAAIRSSLGRWLLRLRIGEHPVERRRLRHRDLAQAPTDPLLGMLAGGFEVQHAVVADHREGERATQAGVLDAIEQQRGLVAVDDALSRDDESIRPHVPAPLSWDQAYVE